MCYQARRIVPKPFGYAAACVSNLIDYGVLLSPSHRFLPKAPAASRVRAQIDLALCSPAEYARTYSHWQGAYNSTSQESRTYGRTPVQDEERRRQDSPASPCG